MHKTKLAGLLLLSLQATQSPTWAQALQCTDIARTLKEYSISTSSTAYLNSVFDNYCETSGSKKSSAAGLGLDAVVKAIPIKFTGSFASSEEGMTNFCRQYAAQVVNQERKFSYEERVAGKALDTVTDCLRLQSQGVVINHEIVNHASSSFFLKSAVDQTITLSGVTTTGAVSCTGQISGVSKPFNQSTNVVVSKTQNFSCIRTPAVADGTRASIYDEATISVATNFGNYNVLWPRDERLPEDQASEVSRSIQSIDAAIKVTQTSLAATQDRLKKLDGPAQAVWEMPNDPRDGQRRDCPEGQVLVGMEVVSRSGQAAILAMRGYCKKVSP